MAAMTAHQLIGSVCSLGTFPSTPPRDKTKPQTDLTRIQLACLHTRYRGYIHQVQPQKHPLDTFQHFSAGFDLNPQPNPTKPKQFHPGSRPSADGGSVSRIAIGRSRSPVSSSETAASRSGHSARRCGSFCFGFASVLMENLTEKI